MKKIPNEIYVSQDDLKDRLNIDGEVNTTLLFTKPIEGLQMTRYVNNEEKWHKITSKHDTPDCDRYNEVEVVAFGNKDGKSIFNKDKICFYDTYRDNSTLFYTIAGLLEKGDVFGEVYWAYVKDFFPKFNK